MWMGFQAKAQKHINMPSYKLSDSIWGFVRFPWVITGIQWLILILSLPNTSRHIAEWLTNTIFHPIPVPQKLISCLKNPMPSYLLPLIKHAVQLHKASLTANNLKLQVKPKFCCLQTKTRLWTYQNSLWNEYSANNHGKQYANKLFERISILSSLKTTLSKQQLFSIEHLGFKLQ